MVILIEPDAKLRALISALFRYQGHRVEAVVDTESALDQLRIHKDVTSLVTAVYIREFDSPGKLEAFLAKVRNLVPFVKIVGISVTHWAIPAHLLGLDAIYDKTEPAEYIG